MSEKLKELAEKLTTDERRQLTFAKACATALCKDTSGWLFITNTGGCSSYASNQPTKERAAFHLLWWLGHQGRFLE